MNGWPPPPPWDCPNPWCYSRAGHAMEHRSRTGRPFLAYPGDIVVDPPPVAFTRKYPAITGVLQAGAVGAIIGLVIGVLSVVWLR